MSQEYFNAYRFVASVISPFVSRDEILLQLTKRTRLDWESVADVAGGHSVIQALYPAFVENELMDLIPDDFLSYVQHLHEINCNRNEMMRRQLINAVLVINKLNIKPLLMKGAAQLFLNTFSNVGDRLLTDLDILVPSDEIKHISNELIAVGYELNEDKIHFIETHHHYPPLIKQDECAMIELHRDLMFREQQHVFPTEYAWEKGIDIALPNLAEAKVLVPTYRVFHSFLHRCVVDKLYQKGQIEIRQMHELARAHFMYSSEIDWEEMFEYAHNHGVHRQLYANLYAASKFMRIHDLEKILNKHAMGSIFQHIRACSKLRYDWFDALDIKLARRINRPQSKS
ncbi:MAG: nucleotidyltransferase family protein [Gammaproteobacteria bacterium]|nr:nucleotidyltransferase family protein [Gammaproteobacteria bacterium]